MTLHIFNPEHDIALAENNEGYVPPKAARQLASDLALLPSLWAEDGDKVIVGNRLPEPVDFKVGELVESMVGELVESRSDVRIQPWGWDKTIRRRLLEMGIPASILPDDNQLNTIRMLSNRTLAVQLLDTLRNIPDTTGFSRICDTYDDVTAFLYEYKDIVVKAPWSSSGRGVRYVTHETIDDNLRKWITNTIDKQGCVIAEIKCPKIHDFAVEFNADANGNVQACGLSVFCTERGAYKGNLLAMEEEKRQWLSQYVSLELLDKVTAQIVSFMELHLQGAYTGPFGVDMMVCSISKGEGRGRTLLNPCVEINLRNTMGHVALALAKKGHRGFMNIIYEDKKFKLKIENKNNNIEL